MIIPCPRHLFNCFLQDSRFFSGFRPLACLPFLPFLEPLTGLPLDKLLKGFLHGLAARKLMGHDKLYLFLFPPALRRAVCLFCHRHLPS